MTFFAGRLVGRDLDAVEGRFGARDIFGDSVLSVSRAPSCDSLDSSEPCAVVTMRVLGVQTTRRASESVDLEESGRLDDPADCIESEDVFIEGENS